MKISKKEAKENKKWIQTMVASGLLNQQKIQSLSKENNEIVSILVTVVKNAEKNK
jgi:four helix bundle protein